MNLEEFRELAAGYALHALSAEESDAVERALREHPQWRSVLDDDLAAAAALGESVAEAVPPPAARGALLSAIADAGTEPADAAALAAVTPLASGRRRAARTALIAAAAVVALLLAIGGGVQLFRTDPVLVALERVDAASDARVAVMDADGIEATLHWSDAASEAVLVTERMPPLGADERFELWLMRDGEPMSLGLFTSPTGEGMMIARGFEPGDGVSVSIETAGGSTTGAPTTEPIIRFRTD